ncbi:MAG: type III pantothenate kinase [Glaciimonas sp.]|nr:type III pantothenate kinase [Glaciimonas sp.]
MLLLVDAGNTRIKWALVDAATELGCWRAFGSVSHAEVGTLAQAWKNLRFSRALLSNVAGAALRQGLVAALATTAVSTTLRPAQITWFASTLQRAGVRNGYRDPAQLGCDRFASVIGAHALFPQQALIIATCGTATTVDALSADGCFVGGMILPGLGLMASALAKSTAQLPHVAQRLLLSEAFADNTDAAIVAGCIAAQTGAIERALAAHAQQHAPVLCVVAGGAASYIAPQLRVPHKIVDNLVLIGLQVVSLQATDSDTSC